MLGTDESFAYPEATVDAPPKVFGKLSVELGRNHLSRARIMNAHARILGLRIGGER